MQKDSIEVKIDHIISDLREIKADLKEAKDSLNGEVVELRIYQEKCKSHWNLVGKTLSLGGIGSAIGYVFMCLFPKPPAN